MKVLMVTPRFYPHVGGVEKHVLRVSEELHALGHTVTIVTEAHAPGLPPMEVYHGLPVYRISRRNLMAMWWGTWRLRRLFRQADVVHCHDHHTLVGWVPHMRAIYRRRMFFVTFHGYEANPPRWYHRLIRRMAVRLSRGHVCIGSYLGKWYRGPCSVARIGGVDVPPQRPPPGEPDHAVFIGRLAEDTEILGYLEAIRILQRRGVNLRVDICGDGPLRRAVEERGAALGAGVRVHGHVPAVEPFLLRARFAFVSRYLAILEALAHGRMVFALHGSDIRKDYLQSIPQADDRMIVTGYPEALADALEEVTRNPVKEREYIAAGEALAREHTWADFARVYLDLYGMGNPAPAPTGEAKGDASTAR